MKVFNYLIEIEIKLFVFGESKPGFRLFDIRKIPGHNDLNANDSHLLL